MKKVFWHTKVEGGVRYFHPSYKQLSEAEIKQVPKEFWQVDPAHYIGIQQREGSEIIELHCGNTDPLELLKEAIEDYMNESAKKWDRAVFEALKKKYDW